MKLSMMTKEMMEILWKKLKNGDPQCIEEWHGPYCAHLINLVEQKDMEIHIQKSYLQPSMKSF